MYCNVVTGGIRRTVTVDEKNKLAQTQSDMVQWAGQFIQQNYDLPYHIWFTTQAVYGCVFTQRFSSPDDVALRPIQGRTWQRSCRTCAVAIAAPSAVFMGVFDMPAVEGLASEPGSGKPELGPERPEALFDVFAPTEPGWSLFLVWFGVWSLAKGQLTATTNVWLCSIRAELSWCNFAFHRKRRR
jgi:hypothetical protein